ncbi:uncharacterized protein LOC111705816 [Eurytemora carolleeae]|uniref:uncharacterized protein LOC111705816 n=1 Tax=Eurytemora carolleeae TaxID=1294199 RepID=UPI000C75CA95|nr:uncharacterized protein LOC111705816 [Eurytemora carolleeae]|eukprot:XP_023334262.1 uncharacterized protein LOC111705816 [Eurytemora affinis]
MAVVEKNIEMENIYENIEYDGFHTFYQGVFSNFYASEFWDPQFFIDKDEINSTREPDNSVRFENVEQYMHASKALLFKDFTVFNEIMKEKDPMKAKKLGRKVGNFKESIWKDVCRDIVCRGCCLKFSQNQFLRREMLKTDKQLFVECAPRDIRWGVGLGVKNPKTKIPGQWRGLNWLGQCLTVAKQFMQKYDELRVYDNVKKNRDAMSVVYRDILPRLPRLE